MTTTKTTNTICYDAILIDDDELVRTMWQIEAQSHQKNILTFASPLEFEKEADLIAKETPLYVDSDLGDGIQGTQVSRELYERGYLTIYLATGHEASEFADMTWIKGVRGKKVPF